MVDSLRSPCEEVATASYSKIPQKNEKWVLAATILGSSMAFIDGTIVNVALPALQNAFQASVNQVQWVVEAYALSLATLLLLGGALGDIYGRRIIFLIGVLLFAGASVWCGLTPTISQLIVARLFQGVGAALLVPGSLALISASFPEDRRGKAIGTWSGFTAINAGIGPVIGGWLVQHASWRWIFFLNLPLAVAVALITILRVPESKNNNLHHRLDITGSFLITLGLGAIVYGLIQWSQGGYIIAITEALGICALLAFIFVEAHSRSPMIPLDMFRIRNFTAANLLTFFLYFALYGVLFFFPLNLIQVQGYSATQAGAALLPLILLIFLLSRWAGGLVKRFGSRLPLVVGPAVAALGFALFLGTNIDGSYWSNYFPAVMVLGLGMAICVAPLTTVVMNSIPLEQSGTASGINNAVSRIAGLLAVAILGLVMIMIFNQQLITKLTASSLPSTTQSEIINKRSQLAAIRTDDEMGQRIIQESFLTGYNSVILIAVILALVSSLSAALFLKDPSKPLAVKRI